MIDRVRIQNDSRLTEAAKELRDGALAFLYEYVLEPLDFYAVLYTLWEMEQSLNVIEHSLFKLTICDKFAQYGGRTAKEQKS